LVAILSQGKHWLIDLIRYLRDNLFMGVGDNKIDIDSFLKQGTLLGLRDGSVLLGWGESFQTSSPHPISPSFYYNDFFLMSSKPWYTFKYNKVFSLNELSGLFLDNQKMSRDWSNPNCDEFSQMFHIIKNDIDKGEIEKAVPAMRIQSTPNFSDLELVRLLSHILRLSEGLIPYGMWNSSGGFLGASPELLFDLLGKRVYSGALAGTARKFDSSHDLVNDPKELGEHKLVIDYLVDQLGRIGEVSLESPRLVSFGNISHLYSPIDTTLNYPVDFSFLVNLLHPTPALGIYPKSGWKEKLKILGHNTGDSYASPFGVSMPMDSSRCIASIRGVSWNSESLTCVAGCGVVKQSQLENEIEEIKHKLQCTLENLGITPF
jgi:isochorismate synthase EntC